MDLSNYRIVKRHELEDLEIICHNMILGGWLPTGGVTPTRNGGYVQAMWYPPMSESTRILIENALTTKEDSK